MRGSTLLVGLVSTSFALLTSPAHAIIGGVKDASDPAVVAVSMPVFGAYCSGSLVAPRLVLTAGHCLDDATSIVIGANESSDESVKVASKIAHPQYTAEGADFDLAVLVLEHDVTDVTPLVTNHHTLDSSLVGKPVRHVGFGTAEEGNVFGIGDKRTVTYPVTSIDSTKVYSGTKTQDTCDGDSGGPALFTGDDGVERVVAVVSDGPDCHGVGWDIRLDHPDVRTWLDPLIAQYGGPPVADSPDAGPPEAEPDAAVDDNPAPAPAPRADAGAVAEPPAEATSPAAGCALEVRATSGAGTALSAFAIAVALLARRRREAVRQGNPAR